MSSIEPQRAMIVGNVWRSIAQSGVDTSAIPREQMERLVNTIADGVLLSVDELMGQATAQAPAMPAATAEPTALADEEVVLWEGRPFLSIGESYVVTNERIRIFRGILGKNVEDLELVRLQDLDYTQSLGERMFNIGDITLRSVNPSNPEVMLRNVSEPEQVHGIIRRAMLDARRRYGVRFREEM